MTYAYGSPWMVNPTWTNTETQPQQNTGSFMTVAVQGEAGANAYPVASGNTVMLIDFESGKFWIKSNMNGIPQRLRTFTFNEEIQNEPKESGSVTREEFDALSNNVATLAANISKLVSGLGGVDNEH